MRYWNIVIVVLGLSTVAVAQDERTTKFLKGEADNFYEDEQYHLAIEYYREVGDRDANDADASFKLAECYRKTFDYPEAEAYYLKAFYLAPEAHPLSLYYYALMLKFNANFDESIAFFNEFIVRHEHTDKLKEYVEQAIVDQAGCETAKEELAMENSTKLISLPFNSSYNDYAPAARDSMSIVITSGRVTSNRQSIDERFGEGFTDNFYFQKQGANWVDKTRQLFSITNTRYNDGSGCFNSRGDKYYFTVCGMGGPQCRLYVTKYVENKWVEPQPLNASINYKSYESKHPSISHGGDTLIFATDRPGGLGQFDLWMSVSSGGENWGPPMNLGNSINTKLNELSPSLTAFPNVLFFSSDGHEGFGGLDLYMAKWLSTGETILYNVGVPFNSNRDDCFVSFTERMVYWSTNRTGGQGGFDVVYARMPSVISFISRLSLKRNAGRNINLKAKTEEGQEINLQASRLEEKIDYDKLTYEKKQIVDEIVQSRLLNIQIDPGKFDIGLAEFEILKRIAETQFQAISEDESRPLMKVGGQATDAEDLSITGVLVDSVNDDKVMSQKILLTDEFGETLKTTRTNQEGKFKFTDVPGGQVYYLRLEEIAKQREQIAIADLKVLSSKAQQFVHFENIYFDFDHYGIRPESRKVLDELADHLIRNPGVQVEIFAFADDRGTNRYNLQLTQKRGQAVTDYLTQKGVDQTGLAIVAKGRQTPKKFDIELQRQYNRRVEFYLNGDAGGFKGSARTYILKKEIDWETLAKVTGVAKQELIALNGSDVKQLKPFQPVRLPLYVSVTPEEWFFMVD